MEAAVIPVFLLPRQHADASVNSAAMKAVLDIACGERPLEYRKPEAREMRADAVLFAVGVARSEDFRTGPCLLEGSPACGGAHAPGICIGGGGKRRRQHDLRLRLPPRLRRDACADMGDRTCGGRKVRHQRSTFKLEACKQPGLETALAEPPAGRQRAAENIGVEMFRASIIALASVGHEQPHDKTVIVEALRCGIEPTITGAPETPDIETAVE